MFASSVCGRPYESFDGKIITAVVGMPFNLKRDRSNPAIILPHGGPTWKITDHSNRCSNALAARGYIVLMPIRAVPPGQRNCTPRK